MKSLGSPRKKQLVGHNPILRGELSNNEYLKVFVDEGFSESITKDGSLAKQKYYHDVNDEGRESYNVTSRTSGDSVVRFRGSDSVAILKRDKSSSGTGEVGSGKNENADDAAPSGKTSDNMKGKSSPPIEKDNECVSCTGITYFNSQLREKKQPPMCIGFKSKSKYLIPAERMRTLDRLPPIRNNAQIFQIGITQSSVRMNKSGRVPVLIFGVEIISEDVKDDKANPEVDSKQKRSEKQQHFQQHLDQQQQHPIRPYVGTPFPISWQLVQQEVSSAVDAASIFANQYSNSCKRQWRGMESLYVRISTDLPSKLQRSAQRLATSAQKRWKTLTRTVLEFVLGTPSK